MVEFSTLPEAFAKVLTDLDCPVFEREPWVRGGPLNERRVALVSSAGIHARGDKHFVGDEAGYRAIPDGTEDGDNVMSHVSVNYDRTAFQQDLEAILPRHLLADLAGDGVIGSVAANHYSFMGATDPRNMEEEARRLAEILKADNVDSIVLIPV